MRRCVFFLAAVMIFCALSATWSARADYVYVKIDLSQVYQNVPDNVLPTNPVGPMGVGPVGVVKGGGPVQPNPNPNPNPMQKPVGPVGPVGPGPMGNPPVKTTGGEGPFLHACIELKSKLVWEGKKDAGDVLTGGYKFDHQWGESARFVITPQLSAGAIKYIFITKDSLTKEFDKTFKKELGQTKDVGKFLNAATWAFQHGLMKEFHATIDELKKLDPKHPVVANYARVQAGLEKPPTADEPSLKGLIADLKAEKYHQVNSTAGFYFALTNMQNNFDGGVKRRVDRLHENMRNYYYWFALNPGLPQPPMPQYRQLLVVTSTIDEFYGRHAQWGAQPFDQDGVTPRRDNFILMSWRPLDDTYRVFDGANQELWKKLQIPKDSFVSGRVWKMDKVAERPGGVFTVAFTQTLSVVQKAIEDESELATLTHEGTRQLLFSTGILPRHVHTPEWIAQGLASYFETPTGAMYHGVGLPSWSNLVTFKHLRLQKKFDKPSDVLMNVYTDRYFRAAQKHFGDLVDAPDKEKINERIREEMDLATSSAWAFTYYLIERRRQPQLLLKYCQELNSLPRDLDLDERALEACFAKVFDVADPSNPQRVDQTKLATLADAWFAEMAGVSLEDPRIQNEYLDNRKFNAKRAAANP